LTWKGSALEREPSAIHVDGLGVSRTTMSQALTLQRL
jgi:hypothetical protein